MRDLPPDAPAEPDRLPGTVPSEPDAEHALAEALARAALPVPAVPQQEGQPDDRRARVDEADHDDVPRRERGDQHDGEQPARDADVDEEATDPLPVRREQREPVPRGRLRARGPARGVATGNGRAG